MREMRLIVAGGREFKNVRLLYVWLDAIKAKMDAKGITMTIVEGGARGADTMGREWAKSRGVKYETFEADWNRYGVKAGGIRNQEMADYAALTPNSGLLAFWNGQSTGTKDMIERAENKKLIVKVVDCQY